MNPDIMYNPFCQNPYYQPLYANYFLQQQQMLQYIKVMFSQQNATMPMPQYKYEQPLVGNNGQCIKQAESPNQNNLVQNSYLTEAELGAEEKGQIAEDESQPRVNGHWTKQEHQLYLEFVRSHESILKSKYDKKSKKIFKLMSQFIPTRTATQCRSHHQKFNPLAKGKKKNRLANKQIPSVILPEN